MTKTAKKAVVTAATAVASAPSAQAGGDALIAGDAGTQVDGGGASDASPVDQGVAPVEPVANFPQTITIRNNGGIAIADPASGAYLPAGGSATVTLHDEAHASRVMDNLKELRKIHLLADDALTVEGFSFTFQNKN